MEFKSFIQYSQRVFKIVSLIIPVESIFPPSGNFLVIQRNSFFFNCFFQFTDSSFKSFCSVQKFSAVIKGFTFNTGFISNSFQRFFCIQYPITGKKYHKQNQSGNSIHICLRNFNFDIFFYLVQMSIILFIIMRYSLLTANKLSSSLILWDDKAYALSG